MRKVDSSGRAQFFPRLQKEAAHSLLFNTLTPPLSLKGAVVNLAVPLSMSYLSLGAVLESLVTAPNCSRF